MKCPKCHSELDEAQGSCPSCGYELDEYADDAYASDSYESDEIQDDEPYDEYEEFDEDELYDDEDELYDDDEDFYYDDEDELYDDDLDYELESEYDVMPDENQTHDSVMDQARTGEETDQAKGAKAFRARKPSLLRNITNAFKGKRHSGDVPATGANPWVDASYEGVENKDIATQSAQSASVRVEQPVVHDEWIDWEVDDFEDIEEPPAMEQESGAEGQPEELSQGNEQIEDANETLAPASDYVPEPVPDPEPERERMHEPERISDDDVRNAPHVSHEAPPSIPSSSEPTQARERIVVESSSWDEDDELDYDSESDPIILPDDDPYVRASAYESGGKRAIKRHWRMLLIVGVSVIAVFAAAMYSMQWNREQVKLDAQAAAAAEEKKRAEAPVEVVLTLDLGGYDPNTMTPAPVHVVGSTAKGPSVDQIVLLRPVRDALVMERGSYIVSLAGPVLSTDGELYEGTVDSFALSITAEGATINGQPVNLGSGSAMHFIYTKIDPEKITDSEIDAAQKWMLDAEIVNYQAYINAVIENRLQAQNYLAAEQAKKEEEERKAAEDAAKKAEAQKKKLEQEKKKKESGSDSSSSSSSTDSSSSSSSTDSTSSSSYGADEYGSDSSTDYGSQNGYGYDSSYDDYGQI